MANSRLVLKTAHECVIVIGRVCFWVRIIIGMLGAVGGLLALALFIVDLVLTWNHGFGTALGGRLLHGQYFLKSHAVYFKVSGALFWTTWWLETIMFSGGGLMLITFAVEGLVWLFGGDSFFWGRRGEKR